MAKTLTKADLIAFIWSKCFPEGENPESPRSLHFIRRLGRMKKGDLVDLANSVLPKTTVTWVGPQE